MLGLLLAGCGRSESPSSQALAREPAPALLEWLRGHEPSRLDVSGISLEAVRRAIPEATVRIVPEDPRAACRAAARDHALLLISAPIRRPARRAAALDCGFALWRDDRAAIVAPR